mgnify:CR=1 FL=1
MKYSATEFANSPLYGLPLVVFDFETTGVDPQECRAVELAVVHVELGKGNEEVVAYSPRMWRTVSVFGIAGKKYYHCLRAEYWLGTTLRMIGRYCATSMFVRMVCLRVVSPPHSVAICTVYAGM